MSAYVVGNHTITKIVAFWMIEAVGQARIGVPPSVRLAANGRPGRGVWQKIGQKLLDLNVRAVNERYPRHPETAEPFVMTPGVRTPTPVEAYKALRCFLYQCCEGTVDRTKLYRELDSYAAGLADYIVSQLPAYESAEWG